MKPLSPRLRAILSEIPPCRTLADVGCDHGLIPLAALEEGRAETVVVTDVSAKSLDKAVRALTAAGYASRMRAYACDGLAGVTEPVDAAVIAGMGGRETVGILERASVLPPRLVLQPMRDQPEVRRYLTARGYEIERDYIVESGNKFYDVISAASRPFPRPLAPREERYGRTDVASPGEDFLHFAAQRKKACRELLARRLPEARRAELILELAELEEITSCDSRK